MELFDNIAGSCDSINYFMVVGGNMPVSCTEMTFLNRAYNERTKYLR